MATAAISEGEARDVAQAFVRARQENRVLMRYPGGQMPTSLDEAYGIQEAAIALDGRALLGWKVGRINDPAATQLGVNRLAGPIFEIIDVSDDPFASPEMPVLTGFAAAEGELLARISPTAEAALARGDTVGMIDALHLGIEIASSPFPDINSNGAPVTVSDFGNNFGAVLGPCLLHHPLAALCDAPMTVTIDGQAIGHGRPADVLDGPLGAVAFIIDHMRRRQLGDPAGLWVSCGAVTGVHQVKAGSAIEVQLLDARIQCRTVVPSHVPRPTLDVVR
jgi:2-keto-4-pentenoate hydratase